MLPSSWRPVATDGLIRLGSEGDGGYVLSRQAVEETSLLLSMGLNDDWTFESAFNAASGAKVACYDGSVDERFWMKYAIRHLRRGDIKRAARFRDYKSFFKQPGITHHRQMIGFDHGSYSVSLASILADEPAQGIFLKADIEGGEYRILDDIVAHQSRFTGIAMELHDIDLHRERISAFLAGLTDFAVVALYPNNVGNVDRIGDPIIVEISLTPKRYLQPNPAASAPPAIPNDPGRPNIELRFAS